MTIEKLNALLAAGQITQEEYDSMAKIIAPEPAASPEPGALAAPSEPDTASDERSSFDIAKIDKIVQSRVDKLMAAKSRENAELKRKLENLQKAKLTEEELRKAELEEKETIIAEREKAIAEKENRLFAVKAIKEAGLDDGSDTILSLVDFVMGADEAETSEKVKSFKELFDKAVSAAVNKRFKENGYTPKKGGNLNGGINPYTKENFSLTEQMRIAIENPELDKQLKAAAGVK